MRILSLYCGAGGIDVGLKKANLDTTTAIDFNRDSCDTFKANNPDAEVIHGDVKEFEESFSNYDIIVGGPPCQPFSRAKGIKRRDFDSSEVDRFWRIVDNNKPRYYLMENVKDVIKVCDKPSELVNFADYGTPQLRQRRIFSNIPLPPKTHENNHVSIKDAVGFDGIVEDRKSTFGEKYKKEGGKFRSRESTRPCFTIIVDYRVWFIKDGVARKATDKEVSVIQGFPEDYIFCGNGSSVKRQIGNAVPSQPIYEYFKNINI